MPELPEVEVTRLSFADRISGAEVKALRMGKPLRWPLGLAPDLLMGRRVVGVRRRGKYLLMDLSQGMLLWHLGMSGSLRFAVDMATAGVHDHCDLVTDRGVLRLHDPRRFGAVVYAEDEADPVAHKLLGHLGAEPLTEAFDLGRFHQGLRQRRVSIKQVLLAGDLVVGVGNIYASEALFLARIHPAVPAHRLGSTRVARLHEAIRQVLARALAVGGSTLRDFSNAQGQSGYFQLETMVYDRQGLPCKVCGQPIEGMRQGQRSTFYCSHCQKR